MVTPVRTAVWTKTTARTISVRTERIVKTDSTPTDVCVQEATPERECRKLVSLSGIKPIKKRHEITDRKLKHHYIHVIYVLRQNLSIEPLSHLRSYCEIAPVSPMHYPSSSVCQEHDCKNGGICFQPPGSSEYICKCAPGILIKF